MGSVLHLLCLFALFCVLYAQQQAGPKIETEPKEVEYMWETHEECYAFCKNEKEGCMRLCNRRFDMGHQVHSMDWDRCSNKCHNEYRTCIRCHYPTRPKKRASILPGYGEL
eukprot:TRINITY_DN112407_c0_g1_i1.p1 TRINITY_DN112407_c0_g1~~TRINITY_DN112407_c0_g1_i1.p1  ORF type:complete len:111 (+),score=3.23 TRINITY_DN112407_c0_g1_i1:179-511(+)